MAFTYLILNIVFIGAILILLTKRVAKPSATWWITLLILLALTLVFDNVIIIFGMVTYNPELILGVRIVSAPVEDFFYALFACIVVPMLWDHFGTQNEKKDTK